ncbi:Nif3-like dinuclear metal center hexameric protein [Sunxiuqinia sp. A32]|uniref:Nif3-like dinuclear metal center hexameric protein n=1 Tax=Sunxiuqinia sp. A32 TaxID=3461496 RepID=UPI00404669B7
MKNKNISRRKFINLSGSGMLAGVGAVSGAGVLLPQFGCSPKSKITAGEVVDRIKKEVAIPWREVTVDTIKGAGTLDIVVTGITTSFMATLDVLKKSVKAGNNFILAHEPTFWTNLDLGEGLEDDPLYAYKQEYIKENGLFVHRFHDHWHARRPDGINEGWMKVMGWDTYKYDEANKIYELPEEITLLDYAKDVKRRLRSDSVRVVGDPKLIVKTVGRGSNKVLRGGAPIADVVIHYEPDRENNNVEWERDIVASGQKKGFIIVSHNRREEDGMDNCARWLRTFISEVPVDFIPSGDPFWRTT